MTPRYVRHPDLRLTALEGEGVVLHLGERRYFTVSETGLTILEALVSSQTVPELVERLLAEYEVEPTHAQQSVSDFLSRCVDAALVRVVDN